MTVLNAIINPTDTPTSIFIRGVVCLAIFAGVVLYLNYIDKGE